MNTKSIILATVISAFCSFAHACTADEIRINVLPFNVQTDYTRPYRELAELGIGNEVGMVRVISTVKEDGCTVTVGYRDPVLYIASELRRNQCAFEHVKAHEDEHIRIYQDALNSLESRIRARAVNEPLFDAAKAEVLAVSVAHALHDTPAEYATNATACSGQVRRLALGR